MPLAELSTLIARRLLFNCVADQRGRERWRQTSSAEGGRSRRQVQGPEGRQDIAQDVPDNVPSVQYRLLDLIHCAVFTDQRRCMTIIRGFL